MISCRVFGTSVMAALAMPAILRAQAAGVNDLRSAIGGTDQLHAMLV